MVTLCLEAMDPLFQRRMWDDKDTEAELEKEIQAELDNMSVSSLEISDETDSPSEVGSESDPGEEDLPESVLYCINIIKNRSKNAENLVLQDLEDTEISGSNYGAVSNNPTEFMDELTSKYHADALELKKRMLFEIEKKLQMNSTSDTIPNSAQLPDLCNLPVDERFSSGDTDTISFGYYEVEERCRQSFAAWEEKQRELENQENKKFRALRDREEKLLQEEEEKRNCRIKQFEIEKKKIENIHKQEEEKLNVELQHQQKLWEEDLKEHEEFIRRLQLQMEEERKSLEELKAKERQRLADQQHNAAIKIQTRYRTFMAYQKYGSIIKERIKKKKMLEKQKQEWKEIADKIRQKDEERKKKMDEKLKRQEETNNQNQKEQEKRQKEYEKKKKILKFKKEQQKLMEEAKREKPFGELVMKNENKKDLVVKKENKKSDEWDKELLMKKENKNQDNMSKEISVKFFTKKKILAIKPLVEEEISEEDKSKHIAPENELKKTDIAEQEPVQKSNQELFGENISRQLIMIEFKKEQKENLVKHQELDESQNEKKLHESLATEQEPMQKLKQKLHREDMSKQLIMIDLEKEQKKNLVKHQELDELQNEKKLHESLATEKEPMQKLKQKLLREDMSRQLITIEFKKEQKENLVKHQELDELQNVKKLHESLATEQEPMQKLKQKLLREDMSKQLIMIDFEKEQKKNLVKHQELDELQNEKKLYESLATEEEPMQKLKQKLLREDMSRQLITIEFKKEQKENLVKHQELDELQNEKKLHESLATEQEPMQKLKQKLLREDMSKQLIMIDFEKEQKENLVKHQELDALQNEKKIHESLATEQEPMQKLKQKLLREDTSKQLIIDFEKEQKKNLIRHQELDELQNEKKLNKSLAKDFIKSQKNEFKENMTNYLQLEQEREKGSSKDENERNKSQEDREVKGSRNKAEQNRNTQILEEDNSEIMKEEKQMNVESLEDGDHFRTSLNLTLSLQKTESKENPFNSVRVIAPAKESDSQAIDNDENSDTNILTDSETIILNTSDIILNMENNSCKKKSVTLISKVYDYTGGSDKSSSLSEETTTVPSVMNEIPGKFCCMSTHSLKKITVSALIEEKRLAWIKICRPWLEIFGEIQTKKIVKTNRPRKCSVSKLPPLNTVEILQGGLWSTLQQVTTVTLQDLPGCSLCTLSECTSLQFLSLRRCGLTALEGLNNCKKLKYIDVQENQIQVINCENLENLCILLLNDNELTSFHGLDDCSNLQNIEASNNKITRIGGLESLKSLQQLIVDHNQLISTRGLCSVPTIMYLDCSYNNLTKVEGIKDCGLLQILKLQGNYLTELPSLENQVLLRELYLDDNSISTMEIISSYWLPLLQILTVSQNSLIEIVPLFQFVSLEKLDVSNNCLSDLTGVARWFDACFNLCDLSLTGNPLLQERNWRQSIFEILPALKILNGETLKSDSSDHEFNVPEPDSFSAFCQTQTQEFNLIFKKYITEKSNIDSLDAVEDLFCYFNELMKLSSRYRDAHERVDFRIIHKDEDLSITKTNLSEEQQDHLKQVDSSRLQQNSVFIPEVNKNKQNFLKASQQRIDSDTSNSGFIASSIHEHIQKTNQDHRVQRRRKGIISTKIYTKNSTGTEPLITSEMENDKQHIQNDAKNEAATELQSHLQGYVIRRQINFCDKKNMAAMIIQRALRNYLKKTQMKKRNCYNTDMHAKREKAATLIQAVWKGFLLRKKLAKALASIKNEELEDDYEEVDIDDFIFDEAALEKEWFSLDSTNFPSQTQDLPNGLHQPKYSGYLSSDDTSLNLPYHPEQAWQNNEKENPCSSEDSQLTDRSESQNLSSSSDIKNYMKTSLRSKKEEKISEEWGFKDISTAQLMLKRAQKMKSKKARHKLDPAVRLALFKNNENKQPPVKPARKAYPARQGYFEVDEEELTSADTAISNEKLERSKELTYQWLHSQVGSYETTCPKNSKGQTHFLPVLDPDVLNGGRVQLVENLLLPNNLKCKEALFKSLHFLKEEDRPTFEAQKILSAQKCKHFAYNARLVRREDVDVDLVSMNSGSALAQNREKNNQASRHSAESSFKVIAVPGIKNTKKKWVSHRDYPVEFSDGWESGKWKAKTFN
ncbi:leucine-rich repeat- and IQ domain-containing protein 1 isoform X2 [Sminthopsis crassicaudata]|uniref:leucine-rich repeat- and IQ domain-containing protein 1 isoform X2 n=2 Tax=Sminthopsis crassicaudata TaxID=9301 RepID=UPI003D681654